MGILSSIRNKLSRHRDEDFSSLRSNVLNERGPGYGLEPISERPPIDEPPPFQSGPPEPMPPGFGMEPMSFNEPMPEKEPLDIGDERTQREIVDRLAFIENQLSAIKSQTETINERLKNMDMKIDRRYR